MYLLLVITVILFCAAYAGVQYYGEKTIKSIQLTSDKRIATLDKKITEIKARKAAEKKAAEEKAAREAKAKKAAEAAARAARLKAASATTSPAQCIAGSVHSDPSKIDVVINKKHCISPIDFVPGDIVYYQGYPVSNKIYANLVAMLSAAQADGEVIGLTSAYRSYDGQAATYNKWVAVNGSTAAADTVSARPGYSEHQSGFAVDLDADNVCSLECFANSSQYVWMKENAANFGFVERYKSGYESITGYSAEAWHWRYVGPTVAKDMKSKGIHTLEQYWDISGGGY